MAALIAGLVARIYRLYVRRLPVSLGQLWIWNRIIRPYVGWRPIHTEAVTRTGLRLSGQLSDTVHNAVYFFGVWEPALTRCISEQLSEGDIFIDVGANVGVHAMHAAQRVGRSGRVHAIEASPTIARILRRNLARNGLDHVVVTHNVAASDRPGTLTVFLHDASNLGATTTQRDNLEASRRYVGEESVAALPLADIVPLDDLLRARMIKIDVEGAEWLVLQGLARTWRGCAPMSASSWKSTGSGCPTRASPSRSSWRSSPGMATAPCRCPIMARRCASA